jgi:hypothetical protein
MYRYGEQMMNTWPLQNACVEFYGDPSQPGWMESNTTRVVCPWPLFMGTEHIGSILINKKCADSLTRVLNVVWDGVGHDADKIKQLRYDQYDGSYNFRPIRGGHIMSMHAFAAAIDWDASDNSQHSQHHLFTDDSPLIKAFKDEGWIWGGDWSAGSIDAMHVQAARIHP